ncbi:hypothetical protein TrispH2_010590 [Trichoplax sp. H2]|uniref:Uncharacterized protein n=1 Tax=Trichoplax adhaerens TaxID=10228 RepID=B3SA58_TRIAD|nr:predicted protein [Trichoplax adhaerens]EDV20375.1 predicted protein [Trichoplax adhaerens]RDD37166.1 hypothetical protein TrispH2_010590 [Trichoplax sp. H2]|eukprot:XP_002117069.1 predicted protein [Trichoplax adhaerens]
MHKSTVDPGKLSFDERKRNIDDAIKWLCSEFESLSKQSRDLKIQFTSLQADIECEKKIQRKENRQQLTKTVYEPFKEVDLDSRANKGSKLTSPSGTIRRQLKSRSVLYN